MKNIFLQKVLILGLSAFIFTSCYSVRIVSKNGVPEKKPIPSEAQFYRDKKVCIYDTTVSLNVLQSDQSLFDTPCECADGFYSVEYRVTLGHILLNAVTFGKVKRIRIKYVCTKALN